MSLKQIFTFLDKKKKEECDLTGSYTALEVAKYIVNKCSSEDKPISNLQLQKILYYVQKEFLQNHKRALFSDDFEAWTFGPVINKIYLYFCGFGSFPIFYVQSSENKIDEDSLNVIDKIVKTKRDLDPWALVADTHTKGRAWDLVYRDGAGSKKIIPKDWIIKYG